MKWLRESWRLRFEDALRDLRYGVRALRRTSGFTIVSILTFAFGIGATATVFSVINAVLIKPLPYPESDSLVAMTHAAPGLKLPPEARGVVHASPTMYFTYVDRNRAFESMGLYTVATRSVTGDGEPEQVRTLGMTEGTLRTLRVWPVLGRAPTQDDDSPGSAGTAILTYGYWQRKGVSRSWPFAPRWGRAGAASRASCRSNI